MFRSHTAELEGGLAVISQDLNTQQKNPIDLKYNGFQTLISKD